MKSVSCFLAGVLATTVAFCLVQRTAADTKVNPSQIQVQWPVLVKRSDNCGRADRSWLISFNEDSVAAYIAFRVDEAPPDTTNCMVFAWQKLGSNIGTGVDPASVK